MPKLKMMILNSLGLPDALGNPQEIEVQFPYENAETLTKRMSYGHVKVIDVSKGQIEVSLSQFEVDGMPVGDGQSFSVDIIEGDKKRTAKFERVLNINSVGKDDEKRRVIVKK